MRYYIELQSKVNPKGFSRYETDSLIAYPPSKEYGNN
jgi:hypothetical protein